MPQTLREADFVEAIIVGAGPAGLAAAGSLRRTGIAFTILERDTAVGSKWRAHYDRLHLHTVKGLSALPGMSYPADYPKYPSRGQIVDYLEAYAQKFQIAPQFDQQVEAVRRIDDSWEMPTTNTIYRSRFVVIATGFNQVPYAPMWPDQDRFKGQIIHSSGYKNGEPFRGGKVLVVGFGNSGAEIAIDLWEHGVAPAMSVRSPVNVQFQELAGIPAQRLALLLKPLPPRLIDALTAPANALRYGDLPRYGLRRLPYGTATQISTQGRIPVIDIGTIKLIRQGHILVHPGIEKFTTDGVILSNGVAAQFDAVILATGYRNGLKSILPAEYPLLDSQDYPLICGAPTSAPGLYFCGFKISTSGMLYEIAHDAERIARDISAKSHAVRP